MMFNYYKRRDDEFGLNEPLVELPPVETPPIAIIPPEKTAVNPSMDVEPVKQPPLLPPAINTPPIVEAQPQPAPKPLPFRRRRLGTVAEQRRRRLKPLPNTEYDSKPMRRERRDAEEDSPTETSFLDGMKDFLKENWWIFALLAGGGLVLFGISAMSKK